MRRTILLGALVAACGSEATHPTDNSPPADCTGDSPLGPYLAHFVEQSGNCGAIADQLVILPVAPDSTCTDNSAPLTADNGCTEATDRTCFDAGTNENIRAVTVIRELKPNVEELGGTVTYTLTNATTGAPICIETYKVTFTKQ